MEEIWKPIKNYDNYEISNFGRFKNSKGKIHYGYTDAYGYKFITLPKKIGERVSPKIHTLVYETFNDCKIIWPNTINHINNIHDDNRLSNLEVMSTQDNTRYTLKNKKRPNFSDEWKKKISESHKGKKQSIDTIKKRTEKLKKKVERNGIIYSSVIDAMKETKISHNVIYYLLKNNMDGWKYL